MPFSRTEVVDGTRLSKARYDPQHLLAIELSRGMSTYAASKFALTKMIEVSSWFERCEGQLRAIVSDMGSAKEGLFLIVDRKFGASIKMYRLPQILPDIQTSRQFLSADCKS